MQFSPLRYFLETARLGSIRKAAEKLHVAPSAVSRQIAMLEHDYGSPLFERLTTGMRLTEAGEVFERQARTTLRDFERLQTEIDDLQQLRRGTVRIVSVWGTAASVVYPAIAEFAREYPGISHHVQVLNSAHVNAALLADECDIAVSFEAPPHPDIEEVQWLNDPIVAVMPPDHPLAPCEEVSFQELADYPVALPDDSLMTRQMLDRASAAEGIALPARIVFNGIGMAGAIARTNRIVSFAPSLVVRNDVQAGLLRVAQINHPAFPAARFVLCRHRTRTPSIPARAFMTVLQRQFTACDMELQGERKQV